MSNIIVKAAALSLISLVPFLVNAQEKHVHDHSNHQHSHYEAGWEFAMSFEYIYLKEYGHSEEEHDEDEEHEEEHDDSESTLGIHAHAIRRLGGEGFQKYFGLGVGGEILFTEDPHYGLMASIAAYPWHNWTLMISPGVSIAKHEGDYESSFTMHYELGYSFEAGNFHIGPVIGFAHSDDDEHYSAGIHIGF